MGRPIYKSRVFWFFMAVAIVFGTHVAFPRGWRTTDRLDGAIVVQPSGELDFVQEAPANEQHYMCVFERGWRFRHGGPAPTGWTRPYWTWVSPECGAPNVGSAEWKRAVEMWRGHVIDAGWDAGFVPVPTTSDEEVTWDRHTNWWAYPLNLAYYLSWLLLICLIVLPPGIANREWRRTSRLERGLCLHCAYDLHGLDPAAPCPECGHARTPNPDPAF